MKTRSSVPSLERGNDVARIHSRQHPKWPNFGGETNVGGAHEMPIGKPPKLVNLLVPISNSNRRTVGYDNVAQISCDGGIMHIPLSPNDPLDMEIRKPFGVPFRVDIFAHDASAAYVDQ